LVDQYNRNRPIEEHIKDFSEIIKWHMKTF
jgi:hypothetical protein